MGGPPRIATGRRIGPAALVADGLYTRTDGSTSPAVLLGAADSAPGRPLADPVAGLPITPAIAPVPGGTAREVGRRPPSTRPPVGAAEREPAAVNGVRAAGAVRMRRIGHALHAEAEAVVDRTLAEAAGRRAGAWSAPSPDCRQPPSTSTTLRRRAEV